MYANIATKKQLKILRVINTRPSQHPNVIEKYSLQVAWMKNYIK